MTSLLTTMFGKLKQGFWKIESNLDNVKPPQDEKPLQEEKPLQDEILPFILTYLTPSMVEVARTQLNETDEGRLKALDELRRLIEAEENLATPTDDIFLLAFLRCRKFNVKNAFKLLQNYWSFRKEYYYIYDNTEFQAVNELILRNFLGMLRFRDRDGSVVFVARAGLWNPDEDSYENVFRAVSGIFVYAVEFPATQITGFRIILDLRGLTWTQLKYCTLGNVLLLIRTTQFCFPGHYKCIHLLTDSKIIHFITAIVFPLLPATLKKNISIHGENLEPIREYIHPSILPKELGGDAPQFDNSYWEDIMEKNSEKLFEMLNYGYKN